jgi:hypothetical protein
LAGILPSGQGEVSLHLMDHPQLALVDHFAEAAVALLSFMFVGVNLAVDILYAWLDPRISYT